MSFFVAGAIVVGAVVAADSASDARSDAKAANKQSLDFEKRKLESWQKVYGSVEKNLSQYYNSLTPDAYAAKGINEFNKQNELALERIRTSLVQRGMMDSGISTAVKLQSELGGAETRAQIRASADDVVASEKKNFLAIGLGQNPGASYSQALQNQAIQANSDARVAEAAAGKAMATAVSTVGTTASDYYNRKQDTTTTKGP